jgi:SAM-dependent methyltransferase
MSRYVQYGCGFTAPDGWVNYDSSPTLRFERLPLLGQLYTRNTNRFPVNVKYGDIVKGLPETADTCDGIYCSHVLEHLSYSELRTALKNTHGMLKPGGIFRLVVPDLLAAAKKYINGQENSDTPANDFMRSTMLGIENQNRSVKSLLISLYGNSKHLWMWDYKTMSHELATAGFINIKPCSFNDSTDPNFLMVEEQSRFVDALAIECSK